MPDIDPRLVPIRTAPLWVRRTLAIFGTVPFLAWSIIARDDFAADLQVVHTFWSR